MSKRTQQNVPTRGRIRTVMARQHSYPRVIPEGKSTVVIECGEDCRYIINIRQRSLEVISDHGRMVMQPDAVNSVFIGQATEIKF